MAGEQHVMCESALIGTWTTVSAATKQAACMLEVILAPDIGSLGSINIGSINMPQH